MSWEQPIHICFTFRQIWYLFSSSQGVGWLLLLFYMYKYTGSFLIARISLYNNISLYQLFCVALPGMGALPIVVRVKEFVETKCNDFDNSCLISSRMRKNPNQACHCIVQNYTYQVNWYFARSISFVAYISFWHPSLTLQHRYA